jgi:hypothetical protein
MLYCIRRLLNPSSAHCLGSHRLATLCFLSIHTELYRPLPDKRQEDEDGKCLNSNVEHFQGLRVGIQKSVYQMTAEFTVLE